MNKRTTKIPVHSSSLSHSLTPRHLSLHLKEYLQTSERQGGVLCGWIHIEVAYTILKAVYLSATCSTIVYTTTWSAFINSLRRKCIYACAENASITSFYRGLKMQLMPFIYQNQLYQCTENENGQSQWADLFSFLGRNIHSNGGVSKLFWGWGVEGLINFTKKGKQGRRPISKHLVFGRTIQASTCFDFAPVAGLVYVFLHTLFFDVHDHKWIEISQWTSKKSGQTCAWKTRVIQLRR